MTAAHSNPSISDNAIDSGRADIVEVVGRYLPLTKQGKEHAACCPFHGERTPSFKVNEVKGIFKCFGCGEQGDAIDFVMKYEGLNFPQAVERIVGSAEIGAASPIRTPPKAPREPKLRAIRTVPETAPKPEFKHWRLGAPVKVWSYFDADGHQVGYVARFATRNRDGSPGKETIPMCWTVNTETGEQDWNWLSFGTPRPLYGAELLAQRPQAPVLVLEGEKTADAGRQLFTGFVGVSWPGGGNAVDMADWPLLAGRDVVLWGDWDAKVYKEDHAQAGELMPEREQPGTKAMERVYAHLRTIAKSIRFVKPMPGAPDGWDLADEAPDPGWTPLAWAQANTVTAADYFEARTAEPVQDAQPDAANDNQQPARKPRGAVPIEFGTPLDVFGIQPPPAMPMEVLPPAIVNYVCDQADLTGCDPGIIALGALVAAASCITDGIRLQPKRHDPTWTESARLWVAFVGDPSTKKSPAISKAVRHVKRIDVGMAEANASAMADYRWQHDSWKEAKKADKNNPPPEPKPPALQRILVEDITVEALSDILKDNPRGVLVLKDELTGWFASMDAYKGGKAGASMDRAKWLEAYNGGRQTVDRVNRGSVVVPNWSASIIGGIQPDMIRRVASAMGNDGLLQRFMVFCARPAQMDADHAPNMDAMRMFGEMFDHLVALQPSANHVLLTEAAHQSRERVARYAKRLIDAIDHAHIQAWLGKWDGLYARLLLLYHVLECYEHGQHPVNAEVGGETAEQVEHLLCGVLLHHAMHFYSEVLDANDRQDSVRQLARLILARGITKLTKRDVTMLWKASRRMPWWEVRTIIDQLGTMGWLEPDVAAVDTDGKPRAWFVNPAVHETFSVQAEREAQRRRDAAEALRELREKYSPPQA
jgi:hypothetical protein